MLAQSVSVASFRALENDLTANTYGTMEKDQNGEIAALIKIVTNETGFLFDGGMTGIVRVKQDVGEVWVYVPHGIKRITIKHPQLGVLRDYYFPIPIAKARTYEMVLSTGKVQTIVQHSVNKQYVIFNVEPANAVVELGDEILSVSEDGYAQKSVGYGKYNYRVSCANYHTQAGVVQVTSKGKAVVNVTLKPNFGWMQLTAPEDQQGAYVYL
ncbi:MAG: PEGA domain-containing protein, partial [Bacteroidales bacterium]|nr:PEGA domain-containing protein [Bacteroidales bacterium]